MTYKHVLEIKNSFTIDINSAQADPAKVHEGQFCRIMLAVP